MRLFYEMEIDFKSWCTKIETRLLTYVSIVQTQFEKEVKIVCVVGLIVSLKPSGIQWVIYIVIVYYIYILLRKINRWFHTLFLDREREKQRERKLGNSNLHQLDSSTYLFHYCNNRQLLPLCILNSQT